MARTLIVFASIVMPLLIDIWPVQQGSGHAQVVEADRRLELCQQLLRKDVKQLSDAELRTATSCLEPLKQRADEKKSPAAEMAPIQQRAPLRIYGK